MKPCKKIRSEPIWFTDLTAEGSTSPLMTSLLPFINNSLSEETKNNKTPCHFILSKLKVGKFIFGFEIQFPFEYS